ncbi:hypothetical protein FIBSPDRAFT_1035611 [Athelia psychrophila]|uniref:GLTSCR protein conserved domain-containing protein n=1 Tax=Athelia psychrophila TaxID=1759441 RepID=A0A166XBI4_9AGAM|nr:hypothetical protein FIBSPDRAFT_1035611 [Fibularhizoctonia sp. CBS 109695]
MSNSLGSSSLPNTSIGQTNQLPKPISWNVITTPSQFVVSTPSSMAHLHKPIHSNGASQIINGTPIQPVASTSAPKKVYKKKFRATEDEEISRNTALRFASSIALDQLSALYPNVDAPFEDAVDVVNRLLPYHIFQQPKTDLDAIIAGGQGKGKAKASDVEMENQETKFALECMKRRRDLQTRFRRARLKAGNYASPSDQAYVLAQAVLEVDRAATQELSNDLRSARTEKDKVDREKKVASMQQNSRQSPFTTFPQTQYYRGYSYAYPQATNGPPNQPTATQVSSYPGSSAPFSNYQPSSASVPVQIPVGSLPALQALGIVPVPASSLPPADQPQPLAILRGSTSNGTMLSLEINVSLLQSAQMNGLALVLNSLMNRGGDTTTGNAMPALGTSDSAAT